jgi:outer membrane protein assembly factor BamB
MKRWNGRVVISSSCALLCASLLHGQGRGGSDWATSGNDPQRSFWVRTDAKISHAGFEKPGFAFLWKQKLGGETHGLNSLTEAVLMERYIGYRGFRAYAHLGTSGDTIVAMDTDLGRIEWKQSIGTPGTTGTLTCPGGLTATPARATSVAFPSAQAGRGGGGRGGPAKSGVGQPGEGAVTLAAVAPPANRGGFPAAPDAAAGRRGGGGGQQRMPTYLYALSSDGKLHAMYVSNGEQPNPPIPFLPANVNATGLTVIDNVAYASTSNACGGAPNGVWALDLVTKQVTSWKAAGNIAGTAGPAFGPDGTIYAGTDAGDLVALAPKTLSVTGTYKSGGSGFTSSPLVFEHKDKPFVAIAAKDGAIHLVPANLGSPAFKSPASSGSGEPRALASWQDADGARWLLAGGAGSVIAWKVVDRNGAPAMEQGWTSRDLIAPLPPMVVNGIVFAVSSGETKGTDVKAIAQRSGKAVLYALDGRSGKELWNSGNTITSFAHSGGLSAAGSQLYLSTYDGTLYAFGFPIEH